MSRKPIKPREQRIAENFFPVEPDDIKYSVEKPYKKPSPEILTIIKESKPKRKTSGKYKKQSKRKKLKKEFKIPKVKFKEDGYELIITEKPQAAMKIASALGKFVKKNIGNVAYYELTRQETGKKIVVACAVGHLFTLTQKNTGTEIPVFDIVWVPNFFVRKGDFSKKYYDVLVKLVKDANSLTIATDYDIEGEVIGLNVVRFIAGQHDASRMKFSTLTDNELNNSYEQKSKNIDWGQAIAGETRHFLDWFYGINLSRALMNAIKTTGRFRVFSIGRVQGPALNLIVQKEKRIMEFKPKKYWQVFITLTEPNIELIHNKDIFNKSQLKKFESLKGKEGIAKTIKKEKNLPPNPPFNLTSLQIESYSLYGLSPGKTLQLAQSLYLNGLISYPRTSSQKLPASIGYKEILKNLAKKYKVQNLITREKPVEGRKNDPAHPSIYPTGQGNISALSSDERKIYELVVRRFLSLFMEDAVIEQKAINVETDGFIFIKRGSSIKKKSWLSIYPKKIKEENLPDVTGLVSISDVKTEEKETQPPKRYTPASLVSQLEKKNLGTKATRASVIDTLYQRGYIKEQSIQATPLGISLIETLEKHSPVIIDEQLTHSFEKEMDLIQTIKKNHIDKERKVITGAKDVIVKIVNQFKTQEQEIGKELVQAQEKLIAQEREENKLNQCPVCKKGNLRIIYSKKTKRSFIGCSSYPDCKNTYSLPPNSLIKPLTPEKLCEHCGFPLLISIRRGKRPWIFCFNPECETNKKRIEEYRKRKEAENNNS